MNDFFENLKFKIKKVALTSAMAAQSLMGIGVTPHAEKSDNNAPTSPAEQVVSQQSPETANDILYGAFDQQNENFAPGDDILYDLSMESENPDQNTFENTVSEDTGVGKYELTDTDLDPQAWQEMNQEEMREIFEEETKYSVNHVDLYEFLSQQFAGKTKEDIQDNYFYERAYYNRNNAIITTLYDIAPENYDKCVNLLCQSLDLSKEDAIDEINWITNPNNVDFITYLSQMEHEDSHRFDHEYNKTFQEDLHPEYMAKLDMLSEIKANIIQAGLAYDMYKATGNLDYFNDIKAIDTQSIKDAFSQNPDMENPKDFIVQSVFKQWLDTYNREGSTYSESAYNNTSPKNAFYPLYALVKSPDADKEYHRRVANMFKDVFGIGDVSKYIDPDFQLNDDLLARLDSDVQEVLSTVEPLDLAKIYEANKVPISTSNDSNDLAQSSKTSTEEQKAPDSEPKQASIEHLPLNTAPTPADQAILPEKAPPVGGPPPKQAFSDLPPQEKGEHFRSLRLGKNALFEREDSKENSLKKPKQTTNQSTDATKTQTSTVVSLRIQELKQRI